MADESDAGPITIKKYANRRLYNTAASSYVTLDDLATMVKDGHHFIVVDARSGDDITRSVLTQILFEEENKGPNLLPIGFLRQLIQFYGDSLQTMVPSYLDHSMRAFADNSERMRGQMGDAVGPMAAFSQWEDMGKQNLAMFERTIAMFSPFARPDGMGGESGGGDGSGAPPATEAAPAAGDDDTIDALKDQLEALQRRVEALSRGKS